MGGARKSIEANNLGLDLNSIRTHDGHGGENMDFSAGF
jgi:hypothetical protein